MLKPINHGGYVVQLQGDGFRFVSNLAGKIASFWVVNKGKNIRSIFAFATSMLDSFAHTDNSEDEMIEKATSLIKEYIDSNKIVDKEEYTFQYKTHQFIFEENPSWWIKTLKSYLK